MYCAHVLSVPWASEPPHAREKIKHQLSLIKEVSDEMHDITLTSMKNLGFSSELYASYQAESASIDFTVRDTWPGHPSFEFNSWSSLLESVKFKAVTGIPKNDLVSIQDIPFVDTYETPDSPLDSTTLYDKVVLVGDITNKELVAENPNITCLPNVDFQSNWKPDLMEKMIVYPSNTIFVFVLRFTDFCDSSLLESCYSCSEPISLNHLPQDFDNLEKTLQSIVSGKLKTILEQLVNLRKQLPPQSHVAVAPFPPHQIFLAESTASLTSVKHSYLHDKMPLSCPDKGIFIGQELDWLHFYNYCVDQLKKPMNNLLVNLCSVKNENNNFDCSFKFITEINESSNIPFPAPIAWEGYIKNKTASLLEMKPNTEKVASECKSLSAPKNVKRMKLRNLISRMKKGLVSDETEEIGDDVEINRKASRKKKTEVQISVGTFMLHPIFLQKLATIFEADSKVINCTRGNI